MIYKKTWERLSVSRFSPRVYSFDGTGADYPQYLDEYTGVFLFWIVPIYISRKRTPLAELRSRV